jgi:UDP-N-acetylglucosamine 2-epimerase (non-hydrolysing)
MASDVARGDTPYRVVLVAGARPNFMKVGPVHEALRADPAFEPILVHTGQHYDHKMSKVFFDELGLPEPDLNLGVGSGSHARQTAAIMVAFESALDDFTPDMVMVVGDVNSTLACALVTQRRGIPVAHVEAGLRSGDRRMPEEINRVLTDQLSDWLYTSCEDAAPNLLREGIPGERIVFVGNVMIDNLVRQTQRARGSDVLDRLGLAARGYALTTLHRPSNVDDPETFSGILGELLRLSRTMPVVFPIHPRTRGRLDPHRQALDSHPGLRVVDPLGYHDFLRLTMDARLVVTDSGGIQEETTYLGVPCITVRENTERPITILEGTNRLVGVSPSRIRSGIDEALQSEPGSTGVPKLWDGSTATRIVAHLRESGVARRSPVR